MTTTDRANAADDAHMSRRLQGSDGASEQRNTEGSKNMTTIDPDMLAAIKKHKELQEADGGVPDALIGNRRQQDRLASYWSDGAPAIADIENRRIPILGGEREIRIYRPRNVKSDAVILFLHGGGWAIRHQRFGAKLGHYRQVLRRAQVGDVTYIDDGTAES
ncbi:hypothetical protein [Phyllobacterium sophorae]|uniref:hypothetical protein n=1 Tax=Phyllobacterium sophorae TaxID=1520277 RepID=UPI001472FB46|nr:hypothetical protein [Phyllobacterium sophorae]